MAFSLTLYFSKQGKINSAVKNSTANVRNFYDALCFMFGFNRLDAGTLTTCSAEVQNIKERVGSMRLRMRANKPWRTVTAGYGSTQATSTKEIQSS